VSTPWPCTNMALVDAPAGEASASPARPLPSSALAATNARVRRGRFVDVMCTFLHLVGNGCARDTRVRAERVQPDASVETPRTAMNRTLRSAVTRYTATLCRRYSPDEGSRLMHDAAIVGAGFGGM